MKTYGYGHQSIDEADIQSVVDVLRGDCLTCGPSVRAFEQAICAYTGAKYCVAVANATAGLHIAALAAGLGPGDEAITSPITFLSSANCIAFVGAKPVFADIDPETANIDPAEIGRRLSPRTRAIIPVHFAGQSCDMARIAAIAKDNKLVVIEDAAHAIGSDYLDSKVGSCRYSDMTVFSFHPVKTITTGEGGAVTTNDPELYAKLCALRAHGVHKDGEMAHTWEYEMRELGFNYRITDIQCALGVSQLRRLDAFKARRRAIVSYYNEHLGLPHLFERDFSNACFHLYPVLVENRRDLYFKAREVGLNLQVHYIPVHTQPYYRSTFGYKPDDYPKSEAYYEKCISLPLYPSLTNEDVAEIVARLRGIVQ
ncbi:MAG: UDP-4-amino-4,6-dideoxy-N-acetyl-beta-L-altrosamine transaminase [Kiritimatiellae bacterium]|nr:UDP-4-amino-4,6-dideoxy-N-acetyl-beta-L-altrosamine transaminase [Kiritimatiellia bacterium]